jgi:glycosyltransferase involved in cell wall biosynthesis
VSGSKIRVLFINSPDRFGADTWVHALVMRSLDRSRCEVHAACAVGPRGASTRSLDTLAKIPDLVLRPTNFGPTIFGRTRLQKVASIPQGVAFGASLVALAAYIRRHEIRILHSTDRPRDAVPCAVLGAMTGAKSVIHVHVKFDDWMGPAVRWAFGRADALVGISEFVSRSLVANGYRASRVHPILNAIDPAAWDYRLDPAPVRRELGILPDAPVVMCASRLFRWKGHVELIRAIAEVKRELPAVRLLIVGSEDTLAGGAGYTDELTALARDLGISESVTFTGQRSDMARLLAASDVFAMASFEEPFGLVFAEAMAMKRPVVTLESGGAPEVVVHGETGLLSPPREVAPLAANLLTLLRDPALRAKMGESGRRRVEAAFTPERLARDMLRLYEKLLDTDNRTAAPKTARDAWREPGQ